MDYLQLMPIGKIIILPDDAKLYNIKDLNPAYPFGAYGNIIKK